MVVILDLRSEVSVGPIAGPHFKKNRRREAWGEESDEKREGEERK